MPENNLPPQITQTPEYDSDNLLHVALWIKAGRPNDPEWRPEIISFLQEDGIYIPDPPPELITETPAYDAGNPEHVKRWLHAGQPPLDVADGDGDFWRPSIATRLVEGAYVSEPARPFDPVEKGAETYEAAFRAAERIIFSLMATVAGAMLTTECYTVQGIRITADNVNREGTRFVKFHRELIGDFKNSGRHPDSGDELYAAIADAPSLTEFPWLSANGGAILGIFAAGLPRNP